MDSAKLKKMRDQRESVGTFSNFSQNDDSDDIDDPISAYFKQRCGNYSKTYFKKHIESDSDSSIGLIDVDTVSLFGDGEDVENKNLRFSENILDQLKIESLKAIKSKKDSDASKTLTVEVKSELDKQRALAQKALQRLSIKTDESRNELSVLSPEKRSDALSDISSKLMNIKLSFGKECQKEWFQPNFSPNTPRCFNDELSSFGGEDENFAKNEVQNNESENFNKNRQSLYAKTINSMLNNVPEIPVAEMEFVSQSKEEQINRFEEDEKKFKLENSALLHNSQISQFSDGNSQWLLETSNLESKTGSKKLSIGQFFTLRSNRVSSLVGSVGDDGNSTPSIIEQSETSSLTNAPMLQLSKSECSFPILDISQTEKPKFRRCVSTYDLKKTPEVLKSVRYSTDSCSSNGTLMIQDILAEMESGLSETQIYEKLMKSYKRRENEGKKEKSDKKEMLQKILENKETPKSSKEPKSKEIFRKNKKSLNLSEGFIKSKSSSDRNPTAPKYKEKPVRDLKLKDVCSPKEDKIKKTEGNKGFFASTPKNQILKSQTEKLKAGKIMIDNNEWEPPRVNSIQLIDLDQSEVCEENEKTIMVNSTTSSEYKKNNTVIVNDTFTIEDTIVAGDLTVISQRIDEMKRDSVCIVRSTEPEEPVLLTVIQKLADLPKGSLDCSALTPLLRDQFPELLSNFPTPPKSSPVNVSSRPDFKLQDSCVALPGSWVKLPPVLGLREKIYAFADLQKTIPVPMVNISQNWVLISIEGLSVAQSQGKGKKLIGVKKGSEWCIMDFVVVSIKETIIPPDNRQTLKVFFKSKVPIKLELKVTFNIKDLMNGEIQTQSLRLLIHNVHPENYINVLPKDPINFGVIADQCFDQTIVQISFDGVSELPLTVYIEEDESTSRQFFLKPCPGQQHEKEWDDHLYHHVFCEGERQALELRILFRPNILLKEDSKTQNFKASLVLMLGGKTESDGILKKIPIKGAIGFAKFLCSSSCSPLVFRASGKNQPVTRPFPLKNVGSLPIAFCFSIMNENHEVVEGEDVFVAPKSFYLSRNEEANFNITFNASNDQNFTKRFLKIQLKPNGRVTYEAELIGIITSLEGRPLSRTSASSVTTKSTVNSKSIPIKLHTTTRSLSWPAVSLEKEVRQTFQIKSLSTVPVWLRITFEKNSDSFKLVNENGEKVTKMRKALKPDCPCALTVVFRPYVVGAFNTSLVFETNLSARKKKILLNGIGGTPNLVMRNVKSDLNGCKILRLQHSRLSNQFENAIEFTNEGRIPAFLLIKVGVKDFSLSHDLKISPSSFVIHSESKTTVKISQKLKHEDLQQLLSEKEICKIATISVITGDEPSRLRVKQLVDGKKLEASERLKFFTGVFQDEKPLAVEKFIDPPGFEYEFLKSIKVHEIAVVVERNSEIFEPSILEETTDEFVSFISYNTVISTVKSQKQTKSEHFLEPQKFTFSNPVEVNTTAFSADSLKSMPSHNRVTKWLETLDCD